MHCIKKTKREDAIHILQNSTKIHSQSHILHNFYSFLFIFSGSDVNSQDEDGRTPLMLACASDTDGRSVEYLIKHKADTSVVDKKGFNALHYAAASGNPYHALVVIFEHATNDVVNGQSVITAMHLAAAQGYDEALAVLLSKVKAFQMIFRYPLKNLL